MADVVVLGGGPTGLSTAMLLAERGLDVVVLDRDEGPPDGPEEAWASWDRKSVTQFRQVHYIQASGRTLLEQHLPGVVAQLESVGAIRFNFTERAAKLLPGGAEGVDFSRFETLTTCRRPLIQYAFAQAAAETPGLDVRYESPASALLTGAEVIAGVPHITGVRTESGATISAQVVIDAAGRRSPLSAMLEAVGGRRPPEQAVDAGFVYNTQYYRGAGVPEYRGDLLSAIGSISILTIPGDDGWWSVTLYHSPEDKAMRKVRDRTVFERVVRSLPLHAHWVDGEPQGDVLPMASTANTTRQFVVDGSPCATGLVPIGDAWGYTNPSLGRGVSLGLLHATDMVPAIDDHLDDAKGLAVAWDQTTEAGAAKWHASTVDFDRIRAPEVQAFLRGEPDPFDPADMAVAGARAFASAGHYDAKVFEWFSEVGNCLSLPDDVIAREGVLERVIEVAMANPPYQTPGPDRAGLEELLV